MDIQVVPSPEPPSQKGPTFGQRSSVAISKFLRISPLDLHFVMKSDVTLACARAEKICPAVLHAHTPAQHMHVPGVVWNTEGPQMGCYFWGPGPILLVMAVGKATMLVIVAKASGEHGGIACRLPCSF